MTNRTLTGWLIHAQPSGESNLFISLFTEEFGLLKTSYPGGQSRKKRNQIQLFTPLWIQLQQHNHRHYCQSIEIKALPPTLNGVALFCGHYINELIYKVLKQPELDVQLYQAYEKAISGLQQCKTKPEMEVILRQFEWCLLISQGHIYSFVLEGNQETPISLSQRYLFKPGYGFYPHETGFSGKTVIAISEHGLHNQSELKVAKLIMRQAIDHLVDNQTIRARALFVTG